MIILLCFSCKPPCVCVHLIFVLPLCVCCRSSRPARLDEQERQVGEEVQGQVAARGYKACQAGITMT